LINFDTPKKSTIGDALAFARAPMLVIIEEILLPKEIP
jgi:hypothetical protein